MLTLSRAVDLYLAECALRGYTQATRRKYADVLYPLVDRHPAKTPLEVTAADCRAFLGEWTQPRPPRRGTRSPRPPASTATLALYVSVLRGFFAFCDEQGLIEQNPMATIQRPRRKRPEDLAVVSVGQGDVRRLFAACEDWDEILCFACLAYLGPRRNAAARVRRGDVDLARGEIRFLEKGGKESVKTLPSEFAAIIRAADENGVWAGPAEYLIPNRRRQKRAGERSNKVVYAIVTRVAARARVRVHPHALRAAFAVQFDEQHPSELWSLKELLGHARIETTLVYLRRKNRARAIEAVRDLSWGRSVFPPKAVVPPAGFEPALRP